MALMLKDFLQNAKQSDRICFKRSILMFQTEKIKLIFCFINFTFFFFLMWFSMVFFDMVKHFL